MRLRPAAHVECFILWATLGYAVCAAPSAFCFDRPAPWRAALRPRATAAREGRHSAVAAPRRRLAPRLPALPPDDDRSGGDEDDDGGRRDAAKADDNAEASWLDRPFFDPDAEENDDNWFARLVRSDYASAEALYAGGFLGLMVVVSQEAVRLFVYGSNCTWRRARGALAPPFAVREFSGAARDTIPTPPLRIVLCVVSSNNPPRAPCRSPSRRRSRRCSIHARRKQHRATALRRALSASRVPRRRGGPLPASSVRSTCPPPRRARRSDRRGRASRRRACDRRRAEASVFFFGAHPLRRPRSAFAETHGAEVDGTGRKSTARGGSRRHGAEVDGMGGSRRHGAEVDGTARKSTARGGSRRHGAEVDATAWKSTPRRGSRRHGAEVDGTARKSTPRAKVGDVNRGG